MDDDSQLSWLIIAVLILFSMYFSATETALSSANRIKIKTRFDRGDRRAKKTLYLLDNFDAAITSLLVGNNIVNITIAALVTVLVTRKWGIAYVALGTVITTVVVFFICEMLPKSIGKKYSERFALSSASLLCFFMKIFKPISYVLTAIGTRVARLTKGDPEATVTEDELYDIIESMKDEGELDAEQGDLVHSALMFADVTVESVLTSRVDVAAIDAGDSQEEILSFIKEQKHSRLPVYRDSMDNIIGILQIRKYIKAYIREGGGLSLESLLDGAYFVHQSTNIDELLPVMSRERLNMAIVTDNYGGTLGIVTVEDILEELVGEIWDEDDEVIETFTVSGDGSFEVDAGVDVEEAFGLMGYSDPDDADFEHKLMGEWVYEQFGLLPKEGDSFSYNGLTVTVLKMRQRRIMKLGIRTVPQKAAEGGDVK